MIRRFFFIAAACGFGLTAAAVEPVNLGLRKDEIRRYVASGEYSQDIAAVAAQAKAWIEERAPRGAAAGRKLAVVLDLDETLLSNWPEMAREDFGFEPKAFSAWVEQGKCPLIEPVREVYRAARERGVAVIYLTGRSEHFRAATERNLRAVDCADYAVLLCRPEGSKEPAGVLKPAARARLEAEGYTIIATIGDQESDLSGGHAERGFKLPGPFYLTK